ncbi:MAG: xanthine dehydrogenase family protein molybdopterin-binding subunit [Chloroflexi bacterium]|nr:xanthine dehydrogenase family protein molybdopterin-binding subunit [Chloroflexota bacterium]
MSAQRARSAINEANGAALVVVGQPKWSLELENPVPAEDDAVLLIIGEDGRATAYSGKVEYGQGIRSGFAYAVADELDLPVDSVEVVLGDTRRVPYDRGTTGSASTRTVGLQLRRAAAAARQALIGMAAEQWRTDAGGLTVRDGEVLDAADADGTGRSAGYGALLKGKSLEIAIPEQIVIKQIDDFRLTADAARRVDAVARVTGAAKYSQDIALPGMLHGKILRPPSYGARLQQVDTTRAEQVPGFVAFVRDGDFAGVVAEREDAAEYALSTIRARWEEARGEASDWSLPGLLKDNAKNLAVLRESGSLDAGFDSADRVFEGVYFIPYVANATMEPCASVAEWDGDHLTIWSGNRSPFSERAGLAEAFNVSEESVDVITAEVGGSFGSKSNTVSYEAARLAKEVGRPVRVGYSREEEFTWSTVRPAALIEIRSGVSADGDIVAWDYIAYHAGETPFRGRRGADTPYGTENVRISVANAESPLSSGSYRSLGGAVNHFAREVHIDEIATGMGIDPVELRMRNLKHPRYRRVLEAATQKFGWQGRNGPDHTGGKGFGVALGHDVGSYVAQCVELSVSGREVQVERVVAAFDCGLALNPDGVRNQVEGSIMMGIGTALWEAMEFDGGRVLNPGFSRYRVPRITDAPEIEVELVGDPDTPSTGAGEPGIVPIAAAVANAVTDATGTRVDQLPIVPRL